jgi:integrase
MATVKLILQQPYKTGTAKDKAEHNQQGQNAGNGTKPTKKRDKPLNPYETRLYCFLIIDRSHVIKIKTEYVIYPKEWDFRNQIKKEILAGSIEFNKKLRALRDAILLKYQNTVKDFPDMPFSQVAKILKEYGKKLEVPFSEDNKGFFDYLDDYMISLKDEVSPLTIAKFKSVKLSIQEFIKTNKKYESLTFSMIDHVFKDSYVNFLRNQEPRGKQKTRPEGFQKGVLLNTEAKYIECLKGFCKWAEERNFNRYATYKEFKSFTQANRKRKKQKADIVACTLGELRMFYAFNFSDQTDLSLEKQQIYERVRDLFCFGCFTVQRWSDIDRFDKSQLDDDVWTFNAFKTKKLTEIDLKGFASSAIDILKKYDYQLPKFSLAKFNLYLKEAAGIAGITKETKIMRYVGANEIPIIKPKNKFLGSHSARRTGVSILLNDYNMNPVHVMRITGHTDLKTLQAYIKTDRDSRRDAVSKTRRIDEPLTVVKQKAG